MATRRRAAGASSSGVGAGIARRGAERAGRLRADGAWSLADDAELDRRFEAAAVAALRVPAIAERSARLRRVGRRVVPERLRPAVRRAAGVLDRTAALALGRRGSGKGRHR